MLAIIANCCFLAMDRCEGVRVECRGACPLEEDLARTLVCVRAVRVRSDTRMRQPERGRAWQHASSSSGSGSGAHKGAAL